MTNMTHDSSLDDAKLRELIIYLCERRITTRSFGHTQLNTLLCMSDFLHYRRFRESITGAEYVCGEHGPWLINYTAWLDLLIESGQLTIHPMELGGYTQNRPLALASANLFGFNGAEISSTEQVLRAGDGQSASDLANLAQALTKWRDNELGDQLTYEAALDEPHG